VSRPPLPHAIGAWQPDDSGLDGCRVTAATSCAPGGPTIFAIIADDELTFVRGGHFHAGESADTNQFPAVAIVPPCTPQGLGDAGFRADHGLRYAYYAGAMANGIGSEELVEALGNAGMMGFFGAAGLAPARIEAALKRLTESMRDKPYGFNLINSPNEPVWQEEVADLYIRYGVPCVEASAYISLSLPLVKYRVTGIHRNEAGEVIAPNRVIAKLSRVEVAQRFFSPPPDRMLKKLVEEGHITEEQATLAAEIPMAQDVTMEADSGGHTDHRPAITALPAMLALRDTLQAKHGYSRPLRVGLGGGIGTPWAAAAAFGMGAAYITTGSINQACVESGSSDLVREMLAKATQTDVGLAPAADMFEMGVTVQVLKKGTRFVTRGMKLFDVYKNFGSLEEIPEAERQKLEEEIFQAPLEDIWAQTEAFFRERDPRQLEKAEKNPRHKMALVFRWYLGQSSGWANRGEATRQDDYQIWCGPSMGAFNEWTRGSFLEDPASRKAATVGAVLMNGAARMVRVAALRNQGIPVPEEAAQVTPAEEAQHG
jgi:PfaD family protein